MGRRLRSEIRRKERMGRKRAMAPFKRFRWLMRQVFTADRLTRRLGTLESPLMALLMPDDTTAALAANGLSDFDPASAWWRSEAAQ